MDHRSTSPVLSVKPGICLLAIAMLALSFAPAAVAQRNFNQERADYVRANYSKFEHMIPMRDGTRLFTSIYVPNELGDASYPMLMVRTPYDVGPYGADRYKSALGPSPKFEKEKYIFVFQDVRGRYMSEGEFVNMRPHVANKRGQQDIDESTDTYDTIEWLLANVEGNNGKVGQWGVSYPGFYSAAGMIDSHPALAAVSPQAPIADWYWDDMHHHGAFILPLAFNFFSSFGQPRPEPTSEDAERFEHSTVDGYQFFLDLGPLSNANARHFEDNIEFWNRITEHPNYDEFWQSRNILPHLDNISAAVMVVGGWFDMEDLYGPLKIYQTVEKNNPTTNNTLVMGPWRHGGWIRGDGQTLGTADFGWPTSKFFRQQALLDFFEFHLKGKGELDLPEALVFETGANRWREFDAWPPKTAERQSLYFGDGGKLSFEAPTSGEESDAELADSYPSDPNKPVPYTMDITTRWNATYMTEDQRFASWRPDVLVYKSEVLDEDVTLAGPIQANLWVSTTGSASDWVVKLIDVHPGKHPDADNDHVEIDRQAAALGGQHMLVRGDVLRGRFRNSYETPEPFEPGAITEVSFELQDVLHTFKRGHRIMVHVQSSWFPLVDRNPQKYVPNIFEATEDDFIKVENTIYRSPEHPSSIEVGVMP